MSGRLVIRPEAEEDLTDAAVWYDSREPGLELELLSEVHSGIARARKILIPLRVFAELQLFVVFSLDGFRTAFSLLFGLI